MSELRPVIGEANPFGHTNRKLMDGARWHHSSNRLKLLFFAALISLALLAHAQSLHAADFAGPEASNWVLMGRDAGQQHFSPLEQINSSNVSKLGLAWYSDLPTLDGVVGEPLVEDGIVYESGGLGRVYANDVRTGKLLWTYRAQIKFPMGVIPSWGSRVSRGLALWDDLVIIATGDCRLIAIARRDGHERWESPACDPRQGYTITGAPRVGGGKVFIGAANGDSTDNRGMVNAFDARTGKHLWRFYTIPGDPSKGFESKTMEMASKTWGKDYWEKVGGGSVWDSLTYDPVLHLLYIGTDGPAPMDPLQRGAGRGDELFSNCVVALNANTGVYVWHYKIDPDDAWNYDVGSPIQIANLDIGGKVRRVVMVAPKAGFFYVLDARTGALVNEPKNIVPIDWATRIDMKTGRPVETAQGRYYEHPGVLSVIAPSPYGAHSWQPMAYSPMTGLVYIPAEEAASSYEVAPGGSAGDVSVDFYYPLEHPEAKLPYKGELIAWDPIAQKARWRHDVGRPISGGTLATAGDLVFHGTSEGEFNAYQAETGRTLWSYATGSGVFAAPVTVVVNGRQVVLLPVGSGTTSSLFTYKKLAAQTGGPARLLAFALNGGNRLPANARTREAFASPPLPRPDPRLAERGKAIYNSNGCLLCHGTDAIGGEGSIPDLRQVAAVPRQALKVIIIDGALVDAGMPRFDKTVSPADVSALQAFFLRQAWAAYDAQKKPAPGAN